MNYQTILIGSGVAGAAIAKQLLERDPKHSLLMLEAGPRTPKRDRRAWWDYVVHNRAVYEPCHDLPLPELGSTVGENESVGPEPWTFRESRLLAYGGSTVHWGGWALRFKPEDFRLFSAVGRGADWPISYDDLEPDYVDAETLLGVSGADPHDWTPRSKPYPHPAFPPTAADGPMQDAFNKLGIPYAPMPVARFRKCMTTGTCKYCPFGARFSAADLLDDLLDPVRHPNFRLQVRSPAADLLMGDKRKVIGVRYLDTVDGGMKTAYGERFVVVSGAVESPKLLMRSQSTYWPRGVGNDQDLVGRHVISHPFLYVRGTGSSNPQRLQQELDFPTLMSRHYDSPKQQRDGKLFLFRDRSKPRINLAGLMIGGKRRDAIDAALTGPVEWELQGFMEEFANPMNRIEPAPGLNRFGLPQTRIRFARAEGFAGAAARRLHWMMDVLRTMGLQLGEFGVQPQRGDHVASTCRMSDDERTGVVDKELRVHGVDNLYVCSNAVFPSGAAVNPTLTLAALALRLGRRLAGP